MSRAGEREEHERAITRVAKMVSFLKWSSIAGLG
jgi:hypothetical protein